MGRPHEPSGDLSPGARAPAHGLGGVHRIHRRSLRYQHQLVIITALKPHPRQPHLTLVEADGARFALISVELVGELGLKQGMVLEGERREKLEFLADVEASHRVAIRLLASRPRAVNEVLRKLKERGHDPSAASRAVGRLEDEGLLNDQEFARHFARVRSARGHGPSRLLTDLLSKGVERYVAARAIDQVLADEAYDEVAQARQVAEKRLRQLGDLPTKKLRRRLIQFLARRGFRGYDITDLVATLIRESGRAG